MTLTMTNENMLPRAVHALRANPPVPLSRTAKRFKKQMFLSVDIPPAFVSMGGKIALAVEKAAVETLKEMERAGPA